MADSEQPGRGTTTQVGRYDTRERIEALQGIVELRAVGGWHRNRLMLLVPAPGIEPGTSRLQDESLTDS